MESIIEQEVLARRAFLRRTREFMRDYPGLNTLFDGQENSDAMILSALERTLQHISDTPPVIELALVLNYPERVLMDGVVADLLQSAAILHARNDLSFSAGGVSVQPTQMGSYLNLSQYLYSRYFSEMKNLKVARNHQLAVDGSGSLHSEWLLVNRPVGRLVDDLFSGAHAT